MNEYFAIETLRALMLRKSAPWKWNRILSFEAHIGSRAECSKAKTALAFITNFIRTVLKLGDEFDEVIINHVVGVLAVNTFWGYNDLGR